MAKFQSLQPIVGARDLERALVFYQRLGFRIAFRDSAQPTNYAGMVRDNVQLHFQFQFEHEMGTIRLRFRVDDPDALFHEYKQNEVPLDGRSVHDTSWGTREFEFYDPDGNALFFYRPLSK